MTDSKIQQTWKIITENYNQHLKSKGVKLPKLKSKKGYSKEALVLIYLAQNYPNTEIVSKEKLTSFIKFFYPGINDVQQARHLSMQKGWNILSGTRGDIGNIPAGSYKLVNLDNPYSAFILGRRRGVAGDWEQIKQSYNYYCATCGSKEGESHRFREGVKIKLEQGHMNPALELIEGNIIPQCQICNRAYRNRWVYDKTGRVAEVADTKDGLRVILKFINKTSVETIKQIVNYMANLQKK